MLNRFKKFLDQNSSVSSSVSSSVNSALALVRNEHFTPIRGLDIEDYLLRQDAIAVHHLIRYLWAIEVLADLKTRDRVVDLGCGCGYGAYLIAKRFPKTEVLGFDYDPAAIDAAKANYQLPNLKFSLTDICKWEAPLEENSYDALVTFDAIEHVSHRELMLENIVRGLTKNGICMLSTPVRSYVEHSPEWEYHEIEYSRASLYDFMRRYFGEVLRSELSEFPHLEVFDRLKDSQISYLLKLNPIVCKKPLKVENPYRKSSALRDRIKNIG